MFIWGGQPPSGGPVIGNGKMYDPASDSWSTITSTGAPQARTRASVVVGNGQCFVFGGSTANGTALGVGAIYDPASNTWGTMMSGGAPSARYTHAAVWTGNRMVIWGGLGNGINNWLGDGFRYRP